MGEDQLQHLELTRDLARLFNNKYGNTFPEPVPILGKFIYKIHVAIFETAMVSSSWDIIISPNMQQGLLSKQMFEFELSSHSTLI